VPEAPKSAEDIKEPERDMSKRRPTDDHDRKLNTLFDLISPASSGERHFDKTWCGTSVWCAGDEMTVPTTDSGSD
jgi:hypothetical protein